MKLHSRQTSSRIARGITWAVLFVLLLGAGVGALLWFNHQQVATPSKESAAPRVQTEPQKAAQFADAPTVIRIPSLAIEAPIINVGLTATGNMDAPNTLTDVGWYAKSAKVGNDSKYSVLLDGHYGTDKDPGIFYTLHGIKEGARIEVEGAGDRTATYEVKEIERRKLEEVDMNKAFHVYEGAKQSLTLITCEGTYDTTRKTYNDRIVVYAIRVS